LTHPSGKLQEIPDAQVRDAADQFEKARKLLDQPPGSGLTLPLINMAAVAIELYLKSLSAERVYESIGGGVSTVSAAPAEQSHRLTKHLDNAGPGLGKDLDRAFRAAHSVQYCNLAFRDALIQCEGAFKASRYPFEAKHDIRKYSLDLINSCSQFLGEFVAKLVPAVRFRHH
jgi:hypothetical protein